MGQKKYIKVTTKCSDVAFILMGSLEDYYRAQGAKIEIPTDEEVAVAFPEVASASTIDELKRQNENLRLENAELRRVIAANKPGRKKKKN